MSRSSYSRRFCGGSEGGQLFFQSGRRELAQLVGGGGAFEVGEGGEVQAAEGEVEVASFGDFSGVGGGSRVVGEGGLHFVGGQHVRFVGERLFAHRVVALVAAGDAEAQLEDRFVVGVRALDGVGGDYRQVEFVGNVEGGADEAGVLVLPDFQVETVGEEGREGAGVGVGAFDFVAGEGRVERAAGDRRRGR